MSLVVIKKTDNEERKRERDGEEREDNIHGTSSQVELLPLQDPEQSNSRFAKEINRIHTLYSFPHLEAEDQ